jgi:uncharacterized membrane protein
MMQVLIFGVVALYIVVMPILFLNWYGLYQQDQEMTESERQISRIVMMIATVLWPIVLPMSYLELLSKVKRYERVAGGTPNLITPLPEMP